MTAVAPLEPDTLGRLDRLLRLHPRTEARYEAEHGPQRVAGLRQLILVGLIFYNVYNFTSVWLMPDILDLSVAMRLLVVTPGSLALAWMLSRVGPAAREGLVLGGMIGSMALPMLLFWLTTAPLGVFTFGESILVVIYGNLLLALRFRHALVFTAVAFLCATLAVFTKAGLDPDLRYALPVQYATGCAFSLYANFRMERQRCRDYRRTLKALLASEAAEAARQRFQGLSHTDPLTGLPNRRLLDETVAAWFAEDRAVALLMIDVDHFKPFNDALGHPEGDACLRRVAALFETFVPDPGFPDPDVLAARFGGEEFAFVVRDAGAPEAARLAAALVSAVENLGISHPARPDGVGVVTISVGVALEPAGLPRAGDARDALFEEADRALYRAKHRGRNGYALADGCAGVAVSLGARPA
ncbi:diguanylate cyclase (GGDEF) domain-containing protein [Methylobacterium sp. ap11]|uniref:GGDEF domain-containing protein n=1 Tax=Methylobacterium sp. ap11 TaxID=1761799 RepID=UPI0008D0FE42|nr:GGDEF domain-containing protein [Methylobacterium sp. ap11]SEO83286.1 diguanylate cyclase (GGDEF) domain-containing protein [Methylobacterium sp. ap11]